MTEIVIFLAVALALGVVGFRIAKKRWPWVKA
jgi:hypothetical protein